jgi:hypothetical protein
LREGKPAQVLLAVDQQIVCAQVRGEFSQQLARDGFAIEPLLQHAEALHPPGAHDQQFAVDRAGQPQGVEQLGEAARNVVAGTGIKPRGAAAVLVHSGHGLHANAVPFPFAEVIAGVERLQIAVLDRMGKHRRAEGRRIAVCRLVGAPFQPGE